MELLYSVPEIYDYYAFADQDDIWSEKKTRIAIEVLQKIRNICMLRIRN